MNGPEFITIGRRFDRGKKGIDGSWGDGMEGEGDPVDLNRAALVQPSGRGKMKALERAENTSTEVGSLKIALPSWRGALERAGRGKGAGGAGFLSGCHTKKKKKKVKLTGFPTQQGCRGRKRR